MYMYKGGTFLCSKQVDGYAAKKYFRWLHVDIHTIHVYYSYRFPWHINENFPHEKPRRGLPERMQYSARNEANEFLLTAVQV